ncbi:WXG100-like domain-containing protein [Streptomyces sp. UC4497]
MLPDELTWLLDLIGIEWPNVDEDDYREMADALREFANSIDGSRNTTAAAVQRLLSVNEGPATDAFAAHWGKVDGKHLHNLAEAGRLGAMALDGAAIAVTGAKAMAIAQLVALGVEIATAQAAAPFTFGLSELGALGATQATRIVVRRLLREAEQMVVDEIMGLASGPVFSALGSMAGDLAIQVGANALGAQGGYDLGQTVNAGKQGLATGVNDAEAQVSALTGGESASSGGAE